MGKNDKAKLGIAVGALVVAGLVMGWFLGAFDSLLETKIPEGAPQVGGTQVTAEQATEYENIKKYNEDAIEKGKAEGATSAGS